MAKHDTLTSFAADLLKVGHQNFYKVCKIDAREDIENVVILRQTVWEIWRKNERGAMIAPPPVGLILLLELS